MAYDFGASRNNRLTLATSVLTAADPRPLSIGFRIKQATTSDRSFGVSQWIYENTYGAGDPNLAVAITVSSTNNLLSIYTSSGYGSSSTWAGTTSWHSLLVTYNTGSPGALAFYRNGAAIGTTTRTFGGGNTTALSSIGALKSFNNAQSDDAGYDPNAGFNIDGSLGEFCIWNVVLDAAEGIAFTAGAAGGLIRPSSLRCWMPFNNGVTQDLYRGAVWTQQGANTKQADHPLIFLPTGPLVMGKPSGVATVTGTGAGLIAPLVGAAAGVHGVAGSAAGIVEQLVGAAAGAHGVTGTGAGTIAALAGAAAGVHGVAGTAAGLIAPLVGAAVGNHAPFIGAGAGLIAPLTGAGAGVHGVTGTAAGLIAPLVGAGAAAHGIAGTAAGLIAPLVGNAFGTFAAAAITGIGAGIIAQLVGAASGSHTAPTGGGGLDPSQNRRRFVVNPASMMMS